MDNVFAWVGQAIVGLTALGALWKYALKPVVEGVRQTYRIARLTEQKLEVLERLEQSVRPNGGSSLRDAVDRIEKEVILANVRARAVLELAPYGVFEADESGDYTYVNRVWQHMTGVRPDEALGSGWQRAILPEDRVQVAESWQSAVEDERSWVHWYRLKHQDTGAVLPVRVSTVAVRGSDQRVLGHIGLLVQDGSHHG